VDPWWVLIGGAAALAAMFGPLSLPAAVAVLLVGATVLILAARRPAPRRTAFSPRTVAAWTVLVLLFAGWEIVAAAWGNDAAHPTFSLLLDPVLDTYPGRFVGWLLWLATGRWLVTRR
jgi:hypothetical protein